MATKLPLFIAIKYVMLSCVVLENTPECISAFAKFARVLIQKLIGSHHESHCVTAYVSPRTWLLKEVRFHNVASRICNASAGETRFF